MKNVNDSFRKEPDAGKDGGEQEENGLKIPKRKNKIGIRKINSETGILFELWGIICYTQRKEECGYGGEKRIPRSTLGVERRADH